MKLSYLVTCSRETTTLQNLLYKLTASVIDSNDEIVVLKDSSAVSQETDKIIESVKLSINDDSKIKVFSRDLDFNYGGHKNAGNSMCSGNFIFQIDADELPGDYILGETLKGIIQVNYGVDLFFVPRINDFRGVNEDHAKRWGWRLTSLTFSRPGDESKITAPVVNYPDYQGRIYKNEPSRIKWDRRLHEKIQGHIKYSSLPTEENFSLYHDKTIEKQIETNSRYNEKFTEEENKGHGVF